ncbi:MAG: flavodoxin [Lachnospiraceae bacterium]|nr:flavodoxin [Lachnospiraceae bacterium]
MKKMTALLLSLFMIFTLAACGGQNSANSGSAAQSAAESTQDNGQSAEAASAEASDETAMEGSAETSAEEIPEEESDEASAGEPESAEGRTLVVYFSATGNTQEAAEYIAAATGGDLFALEPVEPYSDADLNWTDDNSRVVYEHDNPDARVVELVEATVPDWESYDTVFIGYPIWWGIAAWPVDGFIAANDFTGKTVIPFCTSASSQLGESGELLAEAAGTGNWLEGMRFSSGVSEADVQAWIENLGLQN